MTLETPVPLTVKVAVAEAAPVVAVIVSVSTAETGFVDTVNVAVVAPAATLTVAGTVDAVLLDLSATLRVLPEATGPLRVTVPVEGLPPATDVGLRLNADTVGA